jgi:hypothetical protein
MVLRLVAASLRRRGRQLALIATAVAVAAGTVATLAGFSSRVEARLGASLAAFGPNLTVRPQVGGLPAIPTVDLARVRAIPGVASAVGVPAGEQGAGFARLDVRADPRRLDAVARGIEASVAGVEARPLLKTSESDARLTRRLTLVLVAVSVVSLALALLSVGAATSALVGERRAEVSLFLALGYTGRRVAAFFAVELLATALLAGLLGELLGELAAGLLADRILPGAGPGAGGGPAISLTMSGAAGAAVAAVAVVGLAMAVALARVARLDVASVLRGE